MRSKPGRMALFLALSASFSVAACSTSGPRPQTFPLAADLEVPPKPRPTVEILSSAKASAQFNSDLEAWGDALAAQVLRLCGWAKGAGMDGIDCKAP